MALPSRLAQWSGLLTLQAANAAVNRREIAVSKRMEGILSVLSGVLELCIRDRGQPQLPRHRLFGFLQHFWGNVGQAWPVAMQQLSSL